MTMESLTPAAISALEEMASMGPDFRSNVEPGTMLGSEQIEGNSSVQWKKRQSMVSIGGKPLPERIPLWNKQTGLMRLVPPPVAMSRIMRGTRVFPSSAFSLRDPGLPQRVPIDETCAVCDRVRAAAGNPPRLFFDLAQLEAHKQILHPREWETEIRREQQNERLTDRAEMRDLISSIVKALRPDLAGQVEGGIEEQVERQRRRKAEA